MVNRLNHSDHYEKRKKKNHSHLHFMYVMYILYNLLSHSEMLSAERHIYYYIYVCMGKIIIGMTVTSANA